MPVKELAGAGDYREEAEKLFKREGGVVLAAGRRR